jgi:hypothetical protein
LNIFYGSTDLDKKKRVEVFLVVKEKIFWKDKIFFSPKIKTKMEA